jgi:hypothetical protein
MGIMNVSGFLDNLKMFSQNDKTIKLYPYNDKEKLYSRFLKRIYTLDNNLIKIVNKGWIYEIYKETNGIDLGNYYIIPFNKYFNKKPFAFNEMIYEWILNPNDTNDYGDQFYPFLTNGKQIIGLLGNLKDKNENNLIGILRIEHKHITNVIIIASNIYILFENIIKQIKERGKLTFGEDINIWTKNDEELNEYYNNGKIEKYKKRYC